MSTTNTPVEALDELRQQLRGAVLTAEDAGYAELTATKSPTMRHTPLLVVVAEDAADVAAALRHAAAGALGVGVQATGHGPVVPVDDGLLIVTTKLAGITIDPVGRTAFVAAGGTSGAVLAAAQAHGLAPLIGGSLSVGIVGFTLGGGLGWLARKYGAGCDAVRRFDVVTPDGELVSASAEANPELFDALRGGGGGALGVVTGMEIDLFPVTRVYAGNLFFPAAAAVEVVERYRSWLAAAPDDLTSSVVFMNFPPFPDLPEPLRGRSFTVIRGCWSGDIEQGREFVDALRAAIPPVIDQWGEMSFADSAAISGDPDGPAPVVGTGGWLTGLDPEAAAVLAAGSFATAGPPPVVFSEVRHVGGAVTRNAGNGSVLGHRDREFLFHTIAVSADFSGRGARTPEQERLLGELGPALTGDTHHNFLGGELRRTSTRTSTAASRHDVLARLHDALDPEDRLRFGVDHRGT